MKKNIFQSLAILVLTVFSLGSFAQDKRTLDTKVADVLAQMPCKDSAQRDKAMNEITQLGAEGFTKLSAQLVPLGTGNDTAVRFALNSFARYASQFGKTQAKTFAEDNLLAALKAQQNIEVKTFILSQLNLVGEQKTIDAVKEYLNDQHLVEPATQCILMIGKPTSAELFLAALSKAEGEAELPLVRALGELKCKKALAQITPNVLAENASMRKTALAAMANIASPDSYKTLLKAASSVNFTYEATNATQSFIDYTKRLGEENELESMKKACKVIIKENTANSQLHNYSAALAIYAKYLGHEATPLLLAAVNTPDKAFRYSVLNTAEKTGDIADTRLWIAKAESSSPEIKADIISMLGRRACIVATKFVSANLNSPSETVRREAIIALAKLQGTKAIPTLVAHLASGKDKQAAQELLNQLVDKNHLYTLSPLLDTTSGKTLAVVINSIAAKSGTQYFNKILALTSSLDTDEKTAAFKALKHVSTYENTEALLQLLLSGSDEKEITETQMAIIAAIKGVKAEQKADGKILSTLKSTNKKARIFPVLPEISGEVALKTITDYFNTSSGITKDAAFLALINWKNYSAAKSLYTICQTSNGAFKQKAFSNFVRMVGSAQLPDDQKLLQYRKIMPYASSSADKNKIISSIGQLKTFLSIVYLEQFLGEKELASASSRSIMKIALPNNNRDNGFTGDVVRRILTKAEKALSGEDSEYDKIKMLKYLDEMPKTNGFVSLFNGENLDGWQGMIAGGNPLAIDKMSPKEREKLQTEANAQLPENWRVKNGAIVFSGKGHNLVSANKYRDFEMIVDWLITKNGDSGIYLRGTPQVQIWDTSRVEVGAQVGSGGLYNNNKNNVRTPLKVADNPIDEWNTFRITMIGENVTVYLNGELVVDNIKMDNYWNREIPIFDKGTIELQAHGNELAFRNVYVREINTQHIGLSQQEIDEGFVSLFNGKNLEGWQGNLTDYYAENGELVVNPKKGGHGNLFTEKEYSDFNYRFEFKLTPGANNGLGIRAPLKGDAAYVGMELQILDNSAPIYAQLKEYQYHGSIYGTIAAKRGFLKPVGQWNTEEVIVKGSKVKVIVNGEVIVDGDIAYARDHGTKDHKDHPGLKRSKGFIGFLGHGSELYFRNIRIKDLSK